MMSTAIIVIGVAAVAFTWFIKWQERKGRR